MVRFISVKCPECGAALQFEEGRQTAFCSYCGTKILLHNENEYIFRSVDEAGLRQAENDRVYMLKELELEAKEDRHRRILTFLWIIITLAFFAVGFYLINTDPTKDSDGPGWAMVVFGMLIGEIGLVGLLLAGKRKKNRNRPGYVKVPEQVLSYSGMHYSAVEAALQAAGFRNIRVINLGDLRLDLFRRKGSVNSITIDGQNLTDDGWFRQEAPVIISYHGFPNE